MAEMLEESANLESTTVDINRTSATVKGGRRMSFSALVVVGDRRGSVGIGYGKAPGVPAAIEKAQKDARKKLQRVTLRGRTIPHPVTGRFGASSVRLIPAAPGTGVVAGGTVRAVLEMVGISDCLSKAYGSTNQNNLCKAVLNGLEQLRSREEIARNRGVEIDKSIVDEMLEAGERYLIKTAVEGGKKAEAPKNTVGQAKGGRGGRGGPRGGGRGRRDVQQAPAPEASAPAPAPAAADAGQPAPEAAPRSE
jgi:small subunit ribosomal protein S5